MPEPVEIGEFVFEVVTVGRGVIAGHPEHLLVRNGSLRLGLLFSGATVLRCTDDSVVRTIRNLPPGGGVRPPITDSRTGLRRALLAQCGGPFQHVRPHETQHFVRGGLVEDRTQDPLF